jgi:hypothetical protein
VSILSGCSAAGYDFILMDLQNSDVMNLDQQVPWRISDLVHPSAGAIFRQGFIATNAFKGF